MIEHVDAPEHREPADAPVPAHMEHPHRRRRLPSITRRLSATDPLVNGAIAAFGLLKLASTAGITPTVTPDARSYRTAGSWLDFSHTSLDGSSVRPWGATVWMALWPGDRAIVIAQTLLSFVVWSTLALVVASGIRRTSVRRLTVVLVLLVPCTAPVASWDGVMQGDSVSVSAGVLTLALALRFSRAPSWRSAATFLAAALWFSMTRPNVFVVLVVWAAGVAVIGLLRREVRLWGTVAAGLLVISAYTLAYNVRTDRAWTDAYGYSKSTVAYAYPVGELDPVAKSVLASIRRSDAPPCMIPASPHDVTEFGTTHWAATTSRACPAMNAWITKHWNRWWISWLLRHPGSALRIVQTELPNSLSPSVWGNVTAPAPAPVTQLLFGSSAVPQDNHAKRHYRTEPVLLWIGAAIALGLAGIRGSRGRDWTPDSMLALTVLGCLASAISSDLIIQTVPFEVAQESLAAAVLLTTAALIAVGFGLDRLAMQRTGEQRAEDHP